MAVNDLLLPQNIRLAEQIQARLCDLGILDPIINGDERRPFGPVRKADGKVGANTRNGIYGFHRYANLPYVDNLLSAEFFQALAGASPDRFFPVQFNNRPDDDAQTRLARRILRYMLKKGHWIARAPDMFNIVYVEGLDGDGKPNPDRLNEWNDRRMVIRIAPGGKPEMRVNDQATTEPGKYYTERPLQRLGAARIAFGQYKAWVDGLHKGTQPALVQRGRIRLHRDLNRDGFRSASDPIDIGTGFGINQHATSPRYDPAFVDRYSAGCLVGRRYRWHMHFLHIVRQDTRYIMNKGYLFISTIINGDDLGRVEPV